MVFANWHIFLFTSKSIIYRYAFLHNALGTLFATIFNPEINGIKMKTTLLIWLIISATYLVSYSQEFTITQESISNYTIDRITNEIYFINVTANSVNRTESYNDFFPKEELGPYKIIGVEDVTVPAGSYRWRIWWRR